MAHVFFFFPVSLNEHLPYQQLHTRVFNIMKGW